MATFTWNRWQLSLEYAGYSRPGIADFQDIHPQEKLFGCYSGSVNDLSEFQASVINLYGTGLIGLFVIVSVEAIF